jgi:hypothetical protein
MVIFEHQWFCTDHGRSYVISMLDNATSRVHFRFYDVDSTKTNICLLLSYFNLYGRDLSLDKASHFIDNPPKGSRMGLESNRDGYVT